MWRYLKAAFLVGVDVPGVGRLPLNVLAVAATAIFGAVEPSLWLAGGGLEIALLSALTFSPRFQNLTDAVAAQRKLPGETEQMAAQIAGLVAALPPDLHLRMTNLDQSAARVLAIYGSLGFDAATTDTTKRSLERLEWIFLKLLVARNHLDNELGRQSLPELEKRIAQLSAPTTLALNAAAEPDAGLVDTSLQRSREATLDILNQRAANLRSRDRLLTENESDLDRIEQQIELMRENAAIHGKPYAVDLEIDLASDLAAPDLFGAQTGLVRTLDERKS